jgi:hypothetical protein
MEKYIVDDMINQEVLKDDNFSPQWKEGTFRASLKTEFAVIKVRTWINVHFASSSFRKFLFVE